MRRTIKYFTTDMWEGYLNAIEEYIVAHNDLDAHLVIDRFHVAQHYRDDFDDLRKQELRRLKKELPTEAYDQDCKGTLWLLRKNHATLNDEERLDLRRLLAHSASLHLSGRNDGHFQSEPEPTRGYATAQGLDPKSARQ